MGIVQRATQRARILLTDNIQSGGIFGREILFFFSQLFLAKIRLKTESSVFHTYSKPRNKHHRLEGLLRFKKPIVSRKLYIVFQSWLLSSPLKLCEPARFSNVSITCPKICCDVGRKMNMFVYKPKENCALLNNVHYFLTYDKGTRNTCKFDATVNFFSAIAGNITVKTKRKSNLENYNLILCFATSAFY